jgi:phage terminase small subunit
MAKSGRNQFVAVDVVRYGLPNPRLSPPSDMSEAEKAVFLDLICSAPAGQFEPSDMGLLRSWCETSLIARRAARRLELEGMDADGKPSMWLGVHRDAVRTLAVLSVKLRLSPLARSPSTRASRIKAVPTSAYEQLALEEEGFNDDEEADAH